MGEIGEALEAIYMVSKVSKGLKSSLAARLRGAIDVIHSGSEELQRRHTAQEREMRGVGTSAEEVAASRRRAIVAETEMAASRTRAAAAEKEVSKLRKELEEKRAMRLSDIEERTVDPPFPIQRMEMEAETQQSLKRPRSPSPLPQRVTRAKGKLSADKDQTRRVGMETDKTQVSITPPPPLSRWIDRWQRPTKGWS